ncbi:MAG: hypothetical protein AVO33_01945 [delta proteobacterium ML8_F1]|nr:MAG: hypothetical protein AVO33_01945 [delta proteobacterium ML8_F1]
MIEKVALIGLGAIGAAVAEQIVGKGFDFKVIVDEKRKKRYEEEGVYVDGRAIPFEYLTPGEGRPVDFILVASKYHDLEEVIGQLRNFVGPRTVIMSLLNGIDSEEILGGALGMDHLLHAMIYNIASVRQSNRITRGRPGTIRFGSLRGVEDPRALMVKEFFDACGIHSILDGAILQSIWWKFMLNVGVNQMSAITGATNGIITAYEEPKKIMELAMIEVVRIAGKKGIPLSESDMYTWYATSAGLPGDSRSSMLQDVESRRKTEVEMLSGRVIEMGRELGVPTPVNELLFHAIRLKEKLYLEKE